MQILLSLLKSPTALVIIGLTLFGGLQTWRLSSCQGDLEAKINELSLANGKLSLQGAQIGVWKQQATNQAERTREANEAARKAGERWSKLLKAAQNDKPPATCDGSFHWLKDQGNKLFGEFNARD